MIFRKISYRIALQFTAFVFLLLLINGLVFLAADFGNARRQMHYRLARAADMVTQNMRMGPGMFRIDLPPMMREQVRILDADGQQLYSGGLFENVPFVPEEGMTIIHIDNEEYGILTAAIRTGPAIVGYMQIADVERFRLGDLPLRSLLYLFVSAVVSALTFGVGLFFARRSLRPAEHMVERLEQFTQDASHELRTPLAALNSSLDLALRTRKYREGILSAKQDVRDVTMLVERLLELARLDTFAVAMDTIDLSALLEQAVARHRPLAAQMHIEIEAQVAPGVSVRGDASLVRQVVGNLLSNAIKFSKKEGGAIRVRLQPRTLSIEDEGIGIPAADLPHIFDRFYQADTSRAKDGFGLGLALVKRIVDLHGWSIDVRSKQGKGTTFTVRLVS